MTIVGVRRPAWRSELTCGVRESSRGPQPRRRQADGRTYEYVVGLRAVTSTDGMTADFYPFDMKFLGETATRIINAVKGVNRVVYDVTSKPPGTIEWE